MIKFESSQTMAPSELACTIQSEDILEMTIVLREKRVFRPDAA
jgi:hypothetical protein